MSNHQRQLTLPDLPGVRVSKRAYDLLKRLNIRSPGDLETLTPEKLRATPNCGRKTAAEFESIAAHFGVTLQGRDTDSPPDLDIQSESGIHLLHRLDDFNLSVRTANCLRAIGCTFLGTSFAYLRQSSSRKRTSVVRHSKKFKTCCTEFDLSAWDASRRLEPGASCVPLSTARAKTEVAPQGAHEYGGRFLFLFGGRSRSRTVPAHRASKRACRACVFWFLGHTEKRQPSTPSEPRWTSLENGFGRSIRKYEPRQNDRDDDSAS